MLYHKHQNQLKSRAGQVPPLGVPQSARYLPNGVTGPVPPLPAGHMNGIGPGGQPPSLSGPPPYGPANPAGQPNGIPGPPPAPPGAPGQPFPGGMTGRPSLGPQQRLPNGPQQFRSPTMAPSPQAQGNPPQTPAGAMAQLGRSPHMSTVNRAAMPPPNGPQHPQGPGPTGSAHPTPTLSYQQLHRPPSSHGISSQNPMNPHQSPALAAGRIPPGQDRSHMDAVDNELASYPLEVIGDAKRHAGLSDRDPQSLTSDEKQNILHHARMRQNPPNGGVAGPSGINAHGQLPNRGPMAQPMQAQLSMPQRGKRNSTSPGEQHPTLPRNEQSPPDRKRPRRTPIPVEQQQQQPQLQQQQQQPQQSQPQPPPPTSQQPQQTPQPPQQQQSQQPPMTPMGPLPPGPQPGPVRGPLPMTQPPPNGFGGPPMHQMVGPGPMTQMHAMSPGMGHGPMGVMNMVQSQVPYQGQYRQGLVNSHKGNPNMPVHPLDPQSHLRGPGPVPNRLSGPLVPTQSGQPLKGIGGPIPPPGQPGMSGPPKPGGKEGEGERSAPLNPAVSAPTSGPLHNSAPPMNPQRPPTANAPMPTPAPPQPGPGAMEDLSFDMTGMFGNNGGDFDFGPTSLDNMDLWLESTTVHDSSIGMN